MLASAFIAGCGGDQGVEQTQAPPRETAVPGVCYGSQTRCELPVANAWEPGPEVQCEFADQGPAKMDWTIDLSELADFESSGLSVSQIAVGGDRAVWVAMDRYGANVSQAHMVVQLEATGTPLFASTHEYLPSRLDGPRPAVSGIGVDGRGHLLLARPGRGVPAVDLWDYSPEEGQPSVWRLAENVFEAWVRVSADGHVAALYRHAEPPARSVDATKPPAVPTGAANVAMFDAAGRLKFNQTSLSALVMDGRDDAVRLAALPSGHGPMIWTYFTNPGTSMRERALLTQLDIEGNTLWQRELLGSFVNSQPIQEGGLYVLHGSVLESTGLVLERLDADGKGLWRLPLPPTQGRSALIGVDDRGRAVVAEFGFGDPNSVYTISASGTECTRASFEVCTFTPVGSTCGSPLRVEGRSDGIYWDLGDGLLGRALLAPEVP